MLAARTLDAYSVCVMLSVLEWCVQNSLEFLRLRSMKYEILVAPRAILVQIITIIQFVD